MPLPDSVGDYWLGQQRVSAATLMLVKRLWLRMGNDFDESWAKVSPSMVAAVEQAQLKSANLAAEFVPTVLDEQGLDLDVLGEVVPEAFVGVTGGGIAVEDAMYRSVITSKSAVGSGMTPTDALLAGAEVLQTLVQTLLSDTGRAVESVGITARPGVGFVRMLNPPSCSRCVILAGRFYKWNAGFRRHPKCDCRHVPSTQQVAAEISVDPDKYFQSLTNSQQDKAFGPVGAQAIRDGADIGQVVNADRGMQVAQVYGRELAYTTEGVTKRGIAGKLIRARGRDPVTTPRLMPEAIYEIAESREDALRLLKLNGYVLDRSGPSTGVGSRTSLVPDIDELLNVPLYQLPTVDLDRVIASGRVMASPAVRPNPPVQLPTTLSEASPQQVLDTAAGLAAHMRRELNDRQQPVARATTLNAVAYDLPRIADDVLDAGINIQPLENLVKPVLERGENTAMLEVLFGMNRTYESESAFRGATREYSSSMGFGGNADALRTAVALKFLDRSEIEFDLRPELIRRPGRAMADTLIDDILADGLNVEHLIARDITPDVDTAIRARLDQLVDAAIIKDDAALAARNTAEALAAKAQWARNIEKTGSPFKGFTRNYRGTDIESVTPARLQEIGHAVHAAIVSENRYGNAPAVSVRDVDLAAVADEVIAKRLNVVRDGSFDDLEEAESDRALWEIIGRHRKIDERPGVQELLLPAMKYGDLRGREYVQRYADFGEALDALDFDISELEAEAWAGVFEDVVKSRLNVRMIFDSSAPESLRNGAREKFYRILNDEDELDVTPSPAGSPQGLTVARPSAGFSATEPVVPEIDDRIDFMQRLQFENDFLSVPLAARQILGDKGVRVVASRKVSEGPYAAMFDGITSADGRGIDEISFYQNQIKAVVISTDAPNGSVNVVAHEIGHALDSNVLRDSPISVRWQEQGNPNLPPSIVARVQEPTDHLVDRFIDDPYIVWAHKEFIENTSGVDAYYRRGSEGTSESGREEWIAEGYASLVQGNPAQLSAISGGSREAMDILAWTFRRMGVLP